MKLQVVSDLHLEFGPVRIENAGNTDVLILSGDICVANDLGERDVHNMLGEHTKSHRYHSFFEECCAQFPHVIYIAGNHEHYHGNYPTTIPLLRERLKYLSNLHILDKNTEEIDDVLFIGGTLWTDMNKEDPITLSQIRRMMNDYRLIEDTNTPINYKAFLPDPDNPGKEITVFKQRTGQFTPETSVEDHKQMLEVIRTTLASVPVNKKVVIVGHHSPSKQSIKPRYERDVIVNGAYSSELSEFILDHPQIKLWTHGHTHHEFDYMIGSTRIFCNPRGYIGYEDQAEVFDPSKVVEI